MKYDSTSNFLDLRPLVKGINIYICEAVFYFTYMGLKSACQGRWFVRACAILFTERGVIGSQRPGDFLLVCVFLLE